MGVGLSCAVRCTGCCWRCCFPPSADRPQVRQPHYLPVQRHLIHPEVRVPGTDHVSCIKGVSQCPRMCVKRICCMGTA